MWIYSTLQEYDSWSTLVGLTAINYRRVYGQIFFCSKGLETKRNGEFNEELPSSLAVRQIVDNCNDS